jgi:hypothetical protein
VVGHVLLDEAPKASQVARDGRHACGATWHDGRQSGTPQAVS